MRKITKKEIKKEMELYDTEGCTYEISNMAIINTWKDIWNTKMTRQQEVNWVYDRLRLEAIRQHYLDKQPKNKKTEKCQYCGDIATYACEEGKKLLYFCENCIKEIMP